jgi:C-terminal processing protease CtpA/Prc
VPLGLDVQAVTISPDGKTALVTAAAAGQSNLYTLSLDELAPGGAVARQLTSTRGGKSDAQFSPDGKDVFYLENGRVMAISVDSRTARAIDVTAEVTSDFTADRLALFHQAWALMRDNFFDAGFNGVNWSTERATYEPRAAAAANGDDLRRLLRLMVGDLNASHLGVTAPGGATPAVGRLGLRFDRREYETSGRLRVTSVLPLSPSAVSRDIAVGDTLMSVDGHAVGPRVNLDELLANTIDRRVVLSIAKAAGGAARDVVVKPSNQATEKNLLYRDWVETNREYVLKKSGGRLGYVHMLNMSAGALDQLLIDLDADNHKREGVVIDIRNNSGGFVNAYAIDIFTRQPYLRMTLRGLPEAPARTVLGQRALESPTVLVTNQHSLSDAEDFSEGYRTLKLGQVVGEPTAGWIIYTWDARLFDGTTFRLPRMRVKAADGTDMERHPRPVDIAVSRPVGETMTGIDTQLDEAVRALLRKLGYAQ